MSVFTPLARRSWKYSPPELEGRLLDFQGIAAGSEAPISLSAWSKGEFVLTLVERGPVQEMPFFIDLLVLHEADLPVPYAPQTAWCV